MEKKKQKQEKKTFGTKFSQSEIKIEPKGKYKEWKNYHCLINCCNSGATSWGQTKPSLPIVMAIRPTSRWSTGHGDTDGRRRQI